MFEKVNPGHPDKLCDRIGGAIVDLGYKLKENPKIAGECLLGHGNCHIIIETDVDYDKKDIEDIVRRIAGNVNVDLHIVPQDSHLADNQSKEIRCGDNGIFKGCKTNLEEARLSDYVRTLYKLYPFDGKYILDEGDDIIFDELIACQSNVKTEDLKNALDLTGVANIVVNPLGDWSGGSDVDSGACNRKLGSDMGRAVTGGGLHFKDISKADVSINVYLHKLCEDKNIEELTCRCAIGDTKIYINELNIEIPYKEITDVAMKYIQDLGGFEKLAEWGLI